MFMCLSCIDEPHNFVPAQGEIRIGGIKTRDLNNPPEHESEDEDDLVYTLRVMVFEKDAPQKLVMNEYINVTTEVINFKITRGTYDFVFLANEAPYTEIRTALDGIAYFSDLNGITYPAKAFGADRPIPMMQVTENVTVVADYKVKLGDGTLKDINERPRTANQSKGIYDPGDITDTWVLNLDRLGVRLNVVLQSEFDLTNTFEGLILANVPNKVPLFKSYQGTIVRNGEYTIAANQFTDTDSQPSGMSWAKQSSRIILPATFAGSDEGDATVLTVKLADKYSPSCNLEIENKNYSLPYNTWLDFIGTVKEPLEMNIKASDWTEVRDTLETDQIYLNISQTNVNITDFNGARITFESNGESVRITGLYNHTTGVWTGNWVEGTFNQLQWGQEWNRRYGYRYDKGTQRGSGFMDIIVNQYNGMTGKYTLYITAKRKEDWDGGGMSLTRQIDINVTEAGERQWFELPTKGSPFTSTVYIGAFYKYNETGERIIQNNFNGGWWEAVVPDLKDEIPESGYPKDWIILSSTPSFDPKVGTNDPGNAEHYQVMPNLYRGEDGSKVTGSKRIYFRIGLASTITKEEHRYGYVRLRCVDGDLVDDSNPPGEDDTEAEVIVYNDAREKIGTTIKEIKTVIIYVRQGEEPDYVLTTKFDAGDASNTPRDVNAIKKFSPYNVTVQPMMIGNYGNGAEYIQAYPVGAADVNVVHVQYPTQGGALFQWGVPLKDYRRRAYFVRTIGTEINQQLSTDAWKTDYYYETDPFWGAPTNFKDYGEVCPDGYHRPNNGAVTELVHNNAITDAVKSDFFASLFMEIPVGDAHTNIPASETGIVRYTPDTISNCVLGFYADGFFDRHPIKSKTIGTYMNNEETRNDVQVGVCIDDARAAFKGTLFYNPSTYSSVFFPSAGRRDATESTRGKLQYSGGTGFYYSSSLGNQWDTEDPENPGITFRFKNVWQLELSYTPAAISAVPNFASSIRCVADN
ncbi:hypothetical protein D0T85_13890 [Bacteroides sp. 519]|nr:hypothetical protein [Bacteroides sp. 519]